MRLFLKNGKAILQDGRAILCDECPCGGCQYVYYVDHSRDESGDGKTWETAFKSVNDVFNSKKVYDDRERGCVIYVKIRGTVDYQLTGNYVSYSGLGHSNMGAVWLQPENDQGRVTCQVNYESLPLLDRNTLAGDIANIVFDRWDITGSTDYKKSERAALFSSNSVLSIIDTNIDFINDLISIARTTAVIDSCGNVFISNSNIKCNIVREENSPGNIYYNSGYVQIISDCYNLNINNSNFNIDIQAYGHSENEDDSKQSFASVEIAAIEGDPATLKNINVNIFGNVFNIRDATFSSYLVRGDDSFFSSCTSSFNVDVDFGYWLDRGSCYKRYCRFNGSYLDEMPIFSDCEQFCEEYKTSDSESRWCRFDCPPILGSAQADQASMLKTAAPSPSTSCRYAEDTGEKAFPAAPCRGNRIICHKIEGHTSYTKACSPEKCKYYEES